TVTSTTYDLAGNTTTVGSGGGVTARGSDVQANLTPDLAAYLGKDVNAYVSGNIDVLATARNTEGHATAKSYGGGGVDVGIPEASVSSTPAVQSYIGSGTQVHAGGDVTVKAVADTNRMPDTSVLSDYIQSVDTTNSTITFPEHGLQTGGEV